MDYLKNLLSNYLSEILLLVLICVLYFHIQNIRELTYQIYSITDSSAELSELVFILDKKLTQISIWCIFLIGVFKIKRKHNKSLKQDK